MRPATPAIAMMLAAVAGGSACGQGATPPNGLPPDVAAYVGRRAGCNHWSGEDAYDKARGREIASAMKRLKCVRIESDAKRLRHRYARSPRVLRAIDEARDRDG